MHVLSNRLRAKKFFDAISPIYDIINPLLYTKEMRERLLSEREEGPMLDVGVGTGYTSRGLPSVGIDISERMLARATGMRVVGNAEKPPFRKESFSTILCAGSFYYLQDPVCALKIFHGLLRPGGVFLSFSPVTRMLAPFVFIYTESDYAGFFEEAGFVMEKSERMRRIALLVKARRG